MTSRTLATRVGRALLGTTFIVLGYDAASDPGPRTKMADDFGIPNPELAVRLNGSAMVVGGVALAVGVLPRLAALGLATSLVPTTLAGHAYWKMDDPMTARANRLHAFKNLSLIGGLLVVAASEC